MTTFQIQHVSLGGPNYRIAIRGKAVTIEDHPYCGPWPVHPKTLTPLLHEPPGFWDAVQLWIDGGKVVENGECVVPSICRGCDGTGWLSKHLGGRHWEVTGKCEACDGRGLVFDERRQR